MYCTIDMADPVKKNLRAPLRVGGILGFCGGFLLAYQRSTCEYLFYVDIFTSILRFSLVRFWGWSENKREEDMDLAELRKRAQEGKSLYGESDQPAHVQATAYRNSAFSQLKFRKVLIYRISSYYLYVLLSCRNIPHVSFMRETGRMYFIDALLHSRINLVNHPWHGTDPSKYGVESEKKEEVSSE